MIGKHQLGKITDESFYSSLEDGQPYQFFVKSPKLFLRQSKLTDDELTFIREIVKKKRLIPIAHASYTCSISGLLKKNLRNRIIASLKEDLEVLYKIGGYYLVVHFGSELPDDLPIKNYQSIGKAISEIYNSFKTEEYKNIENEIEKEFNDIKRNLKYKRPKIIWEYNVSGFSINLFEKMRKYFFKYISISIELCIDVAHLWGDGYDITTKEKSKKLLEVFSKFPIALFHLNTPAKEFGKKIDRHSTLKKTPMDLDALKEFMIFALIHNIPMILESKPNDEIDDDLIENKKLLNNIIKNKSNYKDKTTTIYLKTLEKQNDPIKFLTNLSSKFIIEYKDITLTATKIKFRYIYETKQLSFTIFDNNNGLYGQDPDELYPFLIHFTEKGTYISNFHRTIWFSGTEIIKTILKFLHLIGVKKIYLQDAASIDSEYEDEEKNIKSCSLPLSLITFLKKFKTFYERFGFEPVLQGSKMALITEKEYRENLMKNLEILNTTKFRDFIYEITTLLSDLYVYVKNRNPLYYEITDDIMEFKQISEEYYDYLERNIPNNLKTIDWILKNVNRTMGKNYNESIRQFLIDISKNCRIFTYVIDYFKKYFIEINFKTLDLKYFKSNSLNALYFILNELPEFLVLEFKD